MKNKSISIIFMLYKSQESKTQSWVEIQLVEFRLTANKKW